jgi:hypothetical protein
MTDDVYEGSSPSGADPLREGRAHEGGGTSSEGSGGDAEPTTEREPPETDPELKDAGEPAEGIADPEGSSGAEEGLNPWAPEAYDADAGGPTTSTEEQAGE